MAGKPKGISWGKAGGDIKEEVALVMKRGDISLGAILSPGLPTPTPAPKQNLPGSGSEGAI